MWLLVFSALFSSDRTRCCDFSKQTCLLSVQIKTAKLPSTSIIMTSYYTSLYYVNNRLYSQPKNSWTQPFWWYGTSCSKKRSENQSPVSANVCVHQIQCKRRTLWTYTIKRPSEVSDWYFCFSVVFMHFKRVTCSKFPWKLVVVWFICLRETAKLKNRLLHSKLYYF